MSSNDAELYRFVREAVAKYGRCYVEKRIVDAHNGRLDGSIVTNENLYHFRAYRNTVSGSAIRMADEAMSYTEKEQA